MLDCARKTVAREGFFKGLYAGTLPAVAANVAENSVLFAGYGACQKLVAKASGVQVSVDLSIYKSFLYQVFSLM